LAFALFNMAVTILVALFFGMVQLVNGQNLSGNGTTTQCFEASAFQTLCTNTYKGVVSTNRCYFAGAPPPGSNWVDAWAICKKNYGSLAHLHSESEFGVVNKYLVPLFGNNYGALAALHDNTLSKTGWDIDLNTTIWFTDSNVSNPLLRAGNTWIRSKEHASGQPWPYTPRCLYLYDYFSKFGDNACVSGNGLYFATLCQLTNPNQNYTKTNICVSETPIETAAVSCPEECARTCSQRPWCRSFNFLVSGNNTVGYNNTCQFFTWAVLETCIGTACATTTNATDNCYHYTSY